MVSTYYGLSSLGPPREQPLSHTVALSSFLLALTLSFAHWPRFPSAKKEACYGSWPPT